MADKKLFTEQIYNVKALGADVLLQDLDRINTAFIEIKKNKIALNNVKAKPENPEEIKKSEAALKDLIVRERELTIELKQKSILMKEYQLLAAQERERKREEARGNQALAGSYNDVSKKYRELLNIAKNTTNVFDPKQVAEAAAELQQLKSALDSFNRALSSDGTLVGEYTTGIINAFKKLGLGDLIENQINQSKTALTSLDNKFEELKATFREMREAGVAGLDAIEAQLIQNRQEAERLTNQVTEMEQALRSTGSIGEQINQQLRESFANLKKEAIAYFITYLSFQQAISAVRSEIQLNARISDQLTDLQRILQATDASINGIYESIRGIETRTPLPELLGFSIIAAKAGTFEKDIAGVTKAIDELQLVAGKELGQNVEKTVESIIKLINIFEGPGQVSEQNIRRYGNALVDLANKGVASGEFLVDFASRLAGIEGITKIQIESVLGLAAAFEEQGQSAEVAASAVTQIVLKMGQDVPKFAALAKTSQEAFRTLLRENPAEALLQVAENLKGDSAAFDEIASKMPELEAKGVRVAGVLGVMADKADFFREKIGIAGTAIKDTTAITEGAAKKQENFAAQVAKITKELQLIGSNRSVQVILSAIATVLGLIVSNLTPIIVLLTAYGALWTIANAAMIRARVTAIAANVVFQAQYAALALSELWLKAYSAALTLYTSRQNIATAAAVLWNEVIMASPLGAIIVTLGLIVAAFSATAAAIDNSTDKLRKNVLARLALTDVIKKSNELGAEENSRLQIQYAIASNVNNSLDTRKKAIQNLINQYPQFEQVLDGERINLQKLKEAYDEVAASIRLASEAKASEGLAAEKQKDVLQITTLRQRVEAESSSQGGGRIFLNGLSDAERKLLLGGFFGNSLSNKTSLTEDGAGGVNFLQKDAKAIVDFLSKIENERERIYKAYIDISSKKQAELEEYRAKVDAQAQKTALSKADDSNLTIKELELLIEAIDKENKGLKELDPQLQKNLERRKALQDRLDKALGKDKTKNSRLDVGDQNAFKDIEAKQKAQRTALELAYQQEDQTKKYYNGKFIGDEAAYLQELLDINTKALNEKLSRLKGKNAEERKTMAELRLELILEQKKTNEELYKLKVDALNAERSRAEQEAKNQLNDIENNPLASGVDKAAAKANYFDRLRGIQQSFNTSMDALEKQYNQASVKNAKERASALEQINRQLNNAIYDADKEAQDNEIMEIQQRFEARAQAIVRTVYNKAFAIYSGGGSAAAKRKQIQDLEQSTADELFNAEIARINEMGDLFKFQLDQNILTKQQYNQKMAQLDEERYAAWKKLNDKEVSEEEKKKNRKQSIIAGTTNVLQTFFEGYINNQNATIDKNYQEATSFLDKEKQKRLAQATSQSEQLAIEEEFEQKRKELERQRNIDRKEVMKKQLVLEYALASIRAINAALAIPGATTIDAVVAEGLVTGEYAAKLLMLESTQFERGGALTYTGGVAAGRPHSQGGTPFFFGGRRYEAEAKELFIVNKRSAASNKVLSVTGTPAQIASAVNTYGGGVNFAPGAIGKFEYGGMLGAGLSAPYFGGGSSSDITELRESCALLYSGLDALSRTVLNIQVTMDPKTAGAKINEVYKKVQVGKI